MVYLASFSQMNPMDHSADCSLFHFVAPCACSSSAWIKYALIFDEDLQARYCHTSVGCISLRIPAGPPCTQPILIK